jgi:hypothetical protein
MHAMNATAWPHHYREVCISTASAVSPLASHCLHYTFDAALVAVNVVVHRCM